MFKKLIQIFALLLPMFLVACGSSSPTGTGGDTTTTTAGYAGTYTGSVTGVNAGPATIVVSSANAVTGNWSITNRTDENGVPTTFAVTLTGTVAAGGKFSADAFLEGALVMSFSGTISSSGGLTGTYFEVAHPGDPAKSGAFTLQGPANGTITTTSTAGSGTGCTGSYVGSVDAPSHEVRIASRNTWLQLHGFTVTGDDAIDNANGGGVDGGIYLEGSFAFETDANCNVVKGQATIFGAPFTITGQVQANRSFTLSYLGPIVGQINADNSITGQLQHGGGEEYIHGDLKGKFTANGKI